MLVVGLTCEVCKMKGLYWVYRRVLCIRCWKVFLLSLVGLLFSLLGLQSKIMLFISTRTIRFLFSAAIEIYLSNCTFTCMYNYLFVYLSVYMSDHLVVYLSVYMSDHLSVLSVCLYTCLYVCLFVYLSVCRNVGLFVYMSICLYVYLFICLSVGISGRISV